MLDVGCGTGYFAEAARQAGYRVAGLDGSRPQLDLARKRFGLTDLYPETLAEYARHAPAGTFDVLTAFQVLEHVADPVAFLTQARRLIARDGYVGLGVPNWRMWSIFREPLDAPPNHLTRWSRTSILTVLERGGFEPLKIREYRSAYGFLLRHVRVGLLRRAMGSPRGPSSGPRSTVLTLAIAKVRILRLLDLPARAILNAVRAPGVCLYALARAR